jgi:hypothetical protein
MYTAEPMTPSQKRNIAILVAVGGLLVVALMVVAIGIS